MPDPTSRLDSLGPLADQRRLSAPRMMSGQFLDEILDPLSARATAPLRSQNDPTSPSTTA
ncbi:MAG: hypothetical protein DMD87_29440 [Candidatus Rokuibacteriota bacterium]|nr:MAG: hypothetical protein DMD87_29440 [Candidatus Rokubacteria bacterium]